MFEVVAGPENPKRLVFEYWNGRPNTTVHEVPHGGRTYVPAPPGCGLVQAVRFPPPSQPFESVAELATSIGQIFRRYAGLLAEAASILTGFSLASSVVDGLPTAPTLHLVGAEESCALVLRLLGCTCARSVLLSDVDSAALATMPARFRATMLMAQRDLSRAVVRMLDAAQNSYFRIVRGKRTLDLYGAKVFSTEGGKTGGRGLELHIPPSQKPLPVLTEAETEKIAAEIQPKLLRYRLQNHARVRRAKMDCEKFLPLSCDEVHAWLAPISDCPELSDVVTKYLLEMGEQVQGTRYSDYKCVVAEAALSFCHEPEQAWEQFLVGELSERANALLQGRNEDAVLSDRKVGSLLHSFGIRAERVTAGYRVKLTDTMRQRIHAIAESYQVLSLHEGVARCKHCLGNKTPPASEAASAKNERMHV